MNDQTKRISQTGGSIQNEELYRRMLNGQRVAPGIPLADTIGMFGSKDEPRKCRFPVAGSGVEMEICGAPVSEARRVRTSYCDMCHVLAYYPASGRGDKSTLQAAAADTKPTKQVREPILDLFGEDVTQSPSPG